MSSRIVVTRGRTGTTVRATGMAAAVLFDAMTRGAAAAVTPQRRTHFAYLAEVERLLIEVHGRVADDVAARMALCSEWLAESFDAEVPAEYVANVIFEVR